MPAAALLELIDIRKSFGAIEALRGVTLSVFPGEVVALCSTLDDEICVAVCDLDRCQTIKANIFDFKAHRMPAEYGLLTQR